MSAEKHIARLCISAFSIQGAAVNVGSPYFEIKKHTGNLAADSFDPVGQTATLPGGILKIKGVLQPCGESPFKKLLCRNLAISIFKTNPPSATLRGGISEKNSVLQPCGAHISKKNGCRNLATAGLTSKTPKTIKNNHLT